MRDNLAKLILLTLLLGLIDVKMLHRVSLMNHTHLILLQFTVKRHVKVSLCLRPIIPPVWPVNYVVYEQVY